MKTLVIPDIHGRLNLLELALKDFPDHNYVFLGDLIDRGEDSRGCIRKAIQLAEKGKARLCYGTHEIMAWMAYKDKGQYYNWWHGHGGKETLASYQSEKEFVIDLTQYLELGEHFYIEGEYLFAHAGIPALFKNTVISEDHLWLRPQDGVFHPAPENVLYSFHGHTPMPSPKLIKPDGVTQRFYFDRGMSALSVFDIESMKFFSYEVGS